MSTSTGTQPPTLTPAPTLPAATVPTFAVSAADSTVTVTLYNATAIQWVQVWIGNADLQEMHLEWHELAAVATCANTTCTLPINLNLPAGDYVSYIQPWGEQVGFVQNEVEGWLGPVTFSLSTAPLADDFAQNNSAIDPTNTPVPTATSDPNLSQPFSAQSFSSTPPSLPDMTGAREVTAGNVSELISEIENANNNCSMPTRITLQPSTDYVLTGIYATTVGGGQPTEPFYSNGKYYGSHGLPIIRCILWIEGEEATITRSSASGTDEFRIFGIDGFGTSDGYLILRNTTVQNGRANATGGAGIFNYFGDLWIEDSRITSNTVNITGLQTLGAGVYSFSDDTSMGSNQGSTEVVIRTSVIDNNRNEGSTDGLNGSDGGGIAVIGAGDPILLEANEIRDNHAERDGGGVFLQSTLPFTGTQFMQGGCVFTNTASGNAAAISYNSNYKASQVWWGTNNLTSINSMVSDPRIIEDPASQAPQDCTSIPSASPQDFATEFFVPLQPADASIPVRLSGTNSEGIYPYINYIDNTALPVLCTRDMNAIPPDNTAPHPIVMPENGTVILIDTNLNADANGLHLNNFGLGRFIAIQIPVSSLDPIVIDALKSSNPNLVPLLDNQVGFIHIGFAHLTRVMPGVDEDVEYPQGTVIAESGNSGTNNTHLDVSVYYVSGHEPNLYPAAFDPNPSITGFEKTNANWYQAYFSIFSTLSNTFGLTELIDPLTLWPLLEESIPPADIQRICERTPTP